MDEAADVREAAGMGTDAMERAMRRYAAETLDRAGRSDFSALAGIARALVEVRARGGRIFTAGNGGSLATAAHMANDFIKGCRVWGRAGFDTECLGDAGAVLTCLANDYSYDEIFAIPLRAKARRGDALVLFSGSGNSPNLIAAARAAREMGVAVFGFLGRDGGALRPLCDAGIIAPSDVMEQIEDMHIMYEHAMVWAIRDELSDRWGMEIVRYPRRDIAAKHVLFDFDGTLSLIREGWREIMIPYFADILAAAPQSRGIAAERAVAAEFVDALTGKQTIYQCMRLDEEVERRGGERADPGIYKAEYLRRLGRHTRDRLSDLRAGCRPERYLVPGAAAMLEALAGAGYTLYLASGTDEADVRDEARLLGIDRFFEGRIYGAHGNSTDCSKEAVIGGILADHRLTGPNFIAFGDGFVEIGLISGIGGYAVGVASDEVRRRGIDEAKRRRLLTAGASLIIPDFAGTDELMALLEGGTGRP